MTAGGAADLGHLDAWNHPGAGYPYWATIDDGKVVQLWMVPLG